MLFATELERVRPSGFTEEVHINKPQDTLEVKGCTENMLKKTNF
ncbi:hypothetical protein IMCC14465_13660 [alpha proteobacterium IMCC14465]|uniref:Uncharacterized protein n=1 Tax=alpha proteobacterium IMCC14465 TaxID=1220535 RepID=J9A5E9_9PROT|nr:hypothetical protein IMCC14465_13660 [alpha proteobacterium IMCC14465]